ncbi:DUF2924 domain-containing protein [uncultured Parasphingopyxis sp.]|uniref:DUF2924 domain-containing protein n=1 Tax=uncultured Parasphingopyxis sp. TaxID=1547918 RepID=UPI00261279C3|nr:DUF2924 domain-containing protein [uncultured Parasphingopyxis sp.]
MAPLDTRVAGLASMTPAQLRAEWRRTFRRETPPHSPDLLARAIAWRWQAKHYGDLSPPLRRRLDQMTSELDATGDIGAAAPSQLAIGTRLVREWNGKTIKVLVTDEGFQFEDRHYQSLSQIARHLTGAHWSGPRFFGLVKRKVAAAAD